MVLDTTSPIFAGLPKMVSCGRYHSLIAQESDFPECLKVTARDENGQIMALQHRETQTYGVQFHPESLLTGDGKRMLANFLNLIPGVSVELPPIVEDRPKTELKKYISRQAAGSRSARRPARMPRPGTRTTNSTTASSPCSRRRWAMPT